MSGTIHPTSSEREILLSAMVELFRSLGEYQPEIVLVGGWIPFLIADQQKTSPPGSVSDLAVIHSGSFDIDLALDLRIIDEEHYKTILEILTGLKYQPVPNRTFSYQKAVSGQKVKVDLLSGTTGGTAEERRHQVIQEVRARKAKGCDFVFNDFIEKELTHSLPEKGGIATVRFKMSGIAPFLIMKAFAMRDRLKDKDFYDVYYVCRNYLGSPDSIAAHLVPYIEQGRPSALEAVAILKQDFISRESVGPNKAVDFVLSGLPENGELRDIYLTDVHMRVTAVLSRLP